MVGEISNNRRLLHVHVPIKTQIYKGLRQKIEQRIIWSYHSREKETWTIARGNSNKNYAGRLHGGGDKCGKNNHARTHAKRETGINPMAPKI